ncbi:hypothetical protein [Aurantiacibacter gilvus]|uniref:Uncharacterized protein n=1 Tax=Aurantiacibacter gilvus TaxID=3139141 RepID=A0ABU9ID04_9SPHN
MDELATKLRADIAACEHPQKKGFLVGSLQVLQEKRAEFVATSEAMFAKLEAA